MNSESIVIVDNLTYEYPGTRALDNVSFRLPRGSVTALVGPNGAGKTTLLRCMAALDQPLDGHIEVDGIDVLEHPRACHQRIGYLSDFFGLYDQLTVQQSLIYAALSHGLQEADANLASLRTAKRLQLDDKLYSRCNNLSRGQRQRVGIGQALIHEPALLILDEPASGLDPEARYELAQVFQQLRADGMTLIVSSHILAELDEYSTHMLVIRNGRIIEYRPLGNSATNTSQCHVRLSFAIKHDNLAELLEKALTEQDSAQLLHCADSQAVIAIPIGDTHKASLLRALVQANLSVATLMDDKENLHESYLRTFQPRPQTHQEKGITP